MKCLELRKFKGDFSEVQDYFPTVDKSVEIEVVELYQEQTQAYCCVEYLKETEVVIHIGVVPEFKTKERIIAIIKCFHSKGIPYLKDKGINKIISMCAYKDKGTYGLLQSLGFDLQAHWLATMEV